MNRDSRERERRDDLSTLVRGAVPGGQENTNHLLAGAALWRHSAHGLAAPQPFLFHYKSPTN